VLRVFLVVRDEYESHTLLARDVTDEAAKNLFEALTRYSDPNRYSVDVLYGRDWLEVCASYPRYADAPDPQRAATAN
jgi:hypothetical protein